MTTLEKNTVTLGYQKRPKWDFWDYVSIAILLACGVAFVVSLAIIIWRKI